MNEEAHIPASLDQPTPEAPKNILLPESCFINDLHKKTRAELQELIDKTHLRKDLTAPKHQLIFELARFYAQQHIPVFASGYLDITHEGYGFLRWPDLNFLSVPEDIYISPTFLRKYNLNLSQELTLQIRAPREREKFLSTEKIVSIEQQPAENWHTPLNFDKLTALFPSERIILENTSSPSPSPRVVDLIAPLGKGQRGLIVAPPRVGKTILLKEIAKSIKANHPEIELIILLLNERPEEVTDFRESVQASIFSSTFDENASRHVHVAEIVIERAKRLVEQKKDVVILLDSLTRLARGYNALQSGKGRIMSGGVESKALIKPKKFFGAARKVEQGGSLTILATALIDTESRMDEVIFEEFKGTGNMELHLDRSVVEQRIFPAVHMLKSGTRKDELLYHPQEFVKVNILRKQLASLPVIEGIDVLVKSIRGTKSNAELLLSGFKL